MKVKAAPGLLVPKLDQPRRYITDDKPVEVAEHEYYRRLLLAGDLVLVADEASAPAAEPVIEDAAPEPEKPAKKGSK